jgi:hypothetical protein
LKPPEILVEGHDDDALERGCESDELIGRGAAKGVPYQLDLMSALLEKPSDRVGDVLIDQEPHPRPRRIPGSGG